MKRLARFVAAIAFLAPAAAYGQGAVLQGGPWTPGHAPMYVGSGSGQAVVQDSGPASGGPVGVGLSELGITARGTGAAPHSNQGTGPFGTNTCLYDAPINNSTGYHYLCMSANTVQDGRTGGLITYGAGGAASSLPLTICVNGACFGPDGNPALTVGVTQILGGVNGGMLYDNAGILGEAATTFNPSTNLTTFNGRQTTLEAGPNWATLNSIYNLNFSNINSFPLNGMFGNNTIGLIQGVVGAIEVPNTSATAPGANGVAGYARTASPTTGAIGVYGQGTAAANGVAVFGANFLATNAPQQISSTNTGFGGIFLAAIEPDVNIFLSGGVPPSGNAFGIYLNGFSETQPTGEFAAYYLDAGAGAAKWKDFLKSADGSTDGRGLVLGSTTTSANSNSQTITARGRNGSNTVGSGTIGLDNGFNWIIAPGTGGVVALTDSLFNTIMSIESTRVAANKPINMTGSSSGTAVITTQAAAGTPTLTLPNASGTFAVSGTSPLVLNATTGALTCPTCATSSGGGAITGTAPIAVSAAGVVSLNDAGVTYAKIQNLGALAIMGRSANSSGVGADIQAIAASDAVLRESGSVIGFGTIATGGIANNAVTLAKLATQGANTVLGNATSGSAVPTALSMTDCIAATKAVSWAANTGFNCNTSITAAAMAASGLTGQVALANGGTAANLTASNGGIFYSTASAGAILSGTATARQMLQSGASGAPAWSATTWPAATTINRLLYSSAANVISDLATANSSILVTDSGGVPSLSTTLPAHTLAGIISGGGNQINNVIIGTSTPLAGSFTSLAYSTTLTGTSTSASSLAVGRQGATNPVLQIDASTASVVTGLKIKGAAAGGAVALSVITSGTNENLNISPAGTGSINLNGPTSVTSTAQFTGYNVTNGSNFIASVIGLSASNDGGDFQLLTGGVTQIRFSANSGVANYINAGSGLNIGGTSDPGSGSLSLAGQIFMPNITTSSAAQTGTVCWTTGTGKFTVDTTVGCLTSIMGAKNITERLAPVKALEIISKLGPFAFRYKNGYGDSGRYEQFGFGAEEVADVDERLAGRDPEGALQGVRYQEMTAVLAGAIQQLKADNDNLKQQLLKLGSVR